MAEKDEVTVVVTSCARHDLLARTLASFVRYNSHPVDRMIIVEDGDAEIPADTRSIAPCEVISTGTRVGQIAAIDHAYSHVETDYIFHLEDDWEFHGTGFIEDSLKVLKANPDCLQVYIRGLEDTNGHPVLPEDHETDGVTWRMMAPGFLNGLYQGFSFNPGLRRLSDYVAIGGYGVHTIGTKGWDDHLGSREAIISRVYGKRGMFAAILTGNDGRGYVRHLGEGRHVHDQPLDGA